jgi:(p)ppGpp synthase/HD superfamily hydrolase
VSNDRIPSALETARVIAYRAHIRQTRKVSGQPYIIHPAAVAEIVKRHDCGVLAEATAWLHDTVEDTELTRPMIVVLVGEVIAGLVMELTEHKLDEEGAKRPWRTRKEEVHAVTLTLSADAACVRAADVIHNMRTNTDDYTRIGERIWQNAGFGASKDDSLWHYHTMVQLLCQRADIPAGLRQELVDTWLVMHEKTRGQ